MARKRWFWKKYRSSPGNENSTLAYSSVEARCCLLLHDVEIKKELEVIQLSNRKGIGALIDDANQIVNDDAAKSNMFNAFSLLTV